MPEHLSADTVIGHIYEASYNPDFWSRALQSVAEFTHSYSAALLYQDNELKRASGMYVFNITDDQVAEYNSYGSDPNFEIMALNTPIGVAAAIDHIIPDREKLEQTYGEEFTGYLIRSDNYHIGGTILFMDDLRSSGLGLQRKRSMGVWAKQEIEKLNILIPHLQRALNIQKEFIRLQTREYALRSGLDRLLMGLILFDKELKPIYINPVAKSVLEYHPAIKIQNNKIYANNLSDTTKIHKALVAAISSHNNESPADSSTALGLNHPDCATTLPLLISPIENVLPSFKTGADFAHAVMCFSDPDRSHPIDSGKIKDVYDLTQAEAQVAISIANGMAPDDIATINKVAISTVRSQIKTIYKKFGINHQTELVKILLTGPFGLHRWL